MDILPGDIEMFRRNGAGAFPYENGVLPSHGVYRCRQERLDGFSAK